MPRQREALLLPESTNFQSAALVFQNTMGQQLNKHIKRKRRAAYLKRKKARTKAAAKKK